MVLLVAKFAKFYSKLENYNHHHHHGHRQNPEADELSASLKGFRSDISSLITKLLLNLKEEDDGLEKLLSMEFIQKCLQVLPMINKAFAKLVMEIDYPMSKWKANTSEEYLNYSLNLLDFLNSFSSSISCLAQAKLSLSHALSLVETSPSMAKERLMTVEFKNSSKEVNFKQNNKEDEKELCSLDQESVILQALMEIKSLGIWVCSIVFGSLTGGDTVKLSEMRKFAGELTNPALIKIDSIVFKAVMTKGFVLKDVKELKDAAFSLAEAIVSENKKIAEEKLKTKLDEFEKLLDCSAKEVDCLFNEILSGRNELLNGIRSPRTK